MKRIQYKRYVLVLASIFTLALPMGLPAGSAYATTFVMVSGAAGNGLTGFIDTFNGPGANPAVFGQIFLERDLELAGFAHTHARADLAAGTLRYRQENAANGVGAAGARFKDVATFSGPFNAVCGAVACYAINFSLTISGTLTAGLATGELVTQGDFFSDFKMSQGLGTGTIVLSTQARTTSSVNIDATIISNALFGAGLQDFSGTATLAIDLPPGVTFTSESGVLLTQAADHFLCYKARPTNDSPKFVPRVVSLADQFDAAARTFDVTRPLSLCTPADKKEEGILDPNTHLKGYQIKLTTTHPPQAPDIKHAVRVTNQFGELLLDTLRPDRLLVPTAKSLTGPVDLPGPNNVDHYKCYKVRVSKGAPKFKPILGVSVSDQFIAQPPKLFDLKKPTRLCNPVDKNGEGIKNPATHLVCYQAKPAKGQPRHQPVSPIFVNNQFGPEIVQTVKEEDLCVPSTKTVLGTLGAISDAEDLDEEDDLGE